MTCGTAGIRGIGPVRVGPFGTETAIGRLPARVRPAQHPEISSWDSAVPLYPDPSAASSAISGPGLARRPSQRGLVNSSRRRQDDGVQETIRVGVIGTGFGASIVAPSFDATADATVVDVVTPRDKGAVAQLCARSDIDLISVHSPPFLHSDHVHRAIEGGHAVLCDKPFGMNVEEAMAMSEFAREAGIVHLLNFERRFDPGRVRLRSLIQDGAIGQPQHFQYSRFLSIPERPYSWLCSRDLGGGWLPGQGSHLIDCCRWLFGEIVDAAGVTRIARAERSDATGRLHRCTAEDGFVATLRSASGVTAVIDCSVESPVSTPEHTAVVGSLGMLVLSDDGLQLTTRAGVAERYDVDLESKGSLVLSMERWAAAVCQAVRRGAPEPGWPTFDDGLACARIMEQLGR